ASDAHLNRGVRDAVPKDLEVDDTQIFSDFQLLTKDDINLLVQKSAKKSCSLDPMPTSLVVKCLDELFPTIMCLVNLSLSSGKFADDWKKALVNPLLKKDNLNLEFCNLCPISNLQFISKLTERAVFDQMYNHMMRFDLYPTLESAYRQGHSTETALLRLHNDIILNMDKKHVTLVVFLDLSAAFETVDHEILISRLRSSFDAHAYVDDSELYLSFKPDSQASKEEGTLNDKDKRLRLSYVRELTRVLRNHPDYYTNHVAFYLDAVSFVHKNDPRKAAIQPKSRVWRKKGEGLAITAKGSKTLAGGRRLHILAAIAWAKGMILSKVYDKMNGDFFAEFIQNNFNLCFGKAGPKTGRDCLLWTMILAKQAKKPC
ncbi:Hypothetical predicted protein, partial [Paramuricea clavata]